QRGIAKAAQAKFRRFFPSKRAAKSAELEPRQKVAGAKSSQICASHARAPPPNSRQPRLVKLALVTETYPPEINGVAMTLSQLVHSLRQRGHRVQVARPRQSSEAAPLTHGPDLVTTRGLPIPRYPDLRFGLPC